MALLLIDPDREETQFLAGKIDMITGDYQDAIAHFKEELRVNPTNDRAYAFLGQIYEDHFNNREQAVRAYEEQLNLKLAIDVLIHVAELYEELGDYELALERYNQARPIAKKMADKRFERQVEAGLSKLKRRMSDG